MGLWRLGATLSLCLALAAVTDLIPSLDAGFGTALPYRAQTEAWRSGQGGLGTELAELRQDHAFVGGRVQQVWGLGGPALRLPFELLFGGFFPDRWVLLLFFAWVVYRYFKVVGLFLSGAGLLFFLPPFLTLLSTHLEVYEEAVAYGNLWASWVFIELLSLLERPSARRALLLGMLIGLGAFVRPTLALYGLAAALIAAWTLRPRTLLVPLYGATAAGILLLLLSNQARFQAPLEFGHHLNVAPTPLNTYALKFDYPFREEPIQSAAQELYAALFERPRLNGADYYRGAFFAGQSPTLRFRHLYFSTFDLPTLVLALVGAIVGLAAAARRVRAAAVFGLLSFAGLFVFYLRGPSLTSRYLVDFAPAIGVLLQPLILAVEATPWRSLRAGLLVSLFLGAGLSAAELPRAYHGPASFRRADLARAMAPPRLECVGLPDVYDLANDPASTGLVAAGEGVSFPTGQTGPSVLLYFARRRCLELRFQGPPGGTFSASALGEVRAKAGAVELLPIQQAITATLSTVWFRAPPGHAVEDPGPVFIATMNPSRAFSETPAFTLVSAAARCPPGSEP